MASPPTGTVTFLFTDIEGSTKLWERYPEGMRAALARHDEVLRSAIEERGGVVFKTVGDAFCAAYPTALEALEAALAAQRALLSEPWGETGSLRVRMALHTGVAEERGGDYFGPSLSRVARLLSAGYGSQILLSLATQELVRDLMPVEADLRDLGEHRLKDLARPERAFQLVAPGLPAEFPPLRTLESRPNNLPMQPTPLVGREREVEDVRERLSRPEVRLLTLTGSGGTGKTRLGLQVAADVLEDFEDGAFFVALSALTDPGLVVSAIAGTLDVRETGDQPLVEVLKDYLRDKELLLLLDNFEQVLEAAPLADELLSVCPGLKVLVTSRAALRLYGEYEYVVPPLALPDPEHLPELETLTQYEAVRLFIERAQAMRADFRITDENAPAVAEICHRLDGLPLAIELAAARVRLLKPQAMLSRLSNRLKLLTGGARNLPERQQTLRGAIDWSYSLLDAGEQALFRRLSVFAGGFVLEAAEAVCDAEGGLQVDVLDGVESLLGKSLLRGNEGDLESRLVMMETIREYALEQLEASGEAGELRRRHAEFFLALAEEAEPELDGPQQAEWLERLETEHDNLRAALLWALEGEDASLGLRLAGALGKFWWSRGHLSEGAGWLESVLRSGEQPKPARAKALYEASQIAWLRGDLDRAESLAEESAALYQEAGERQGLTRSLVAQGHSAADRGDWQRAESFYREALDLGRELGDKERMFAALLNLGWAALCQEDYGRATEACREALGLARETENKSGVAAASNNLGWAALGQGDHAGASALFSEALTMFWELGNRVDATEALEGFAGLAGAQGEGKRAARLYGAAEALRETLGAPLLPGDQSRHERQLAAARSLVDEAPWEAAWEVGRAMTLEEAISYAFEEDERA